MPLKKRACFLLERRACRSFRADSISSQALPSTLPFLRASSSPLPKCTRGCPRRGPLTCQLSYDGGLCKNKMAFWGPILCSQYSRPILLQRFGLKTRDSHTEARVSTGIGKLNFYSHVPMPLDSASLLNPHGVSQNTGRRGPNFSKPQTLNNASKRPG